MDETTIVCPNCSTEIKLNESLAGPLIQATREEYEQKMRDQASAIADREQQLKKQRDDLEKAKDAIDAQVAEKLKTERASIAEAEAKKARTFLSLELQERDEKLKEMQETLLTREAKLAEAQKQQAEFLKKQRELEDARRELDLAVEKKVQEGLESARAKAKAEVEEGLKLKVAEKEEQIAGMQRQIDELKRRSEQGSQQLQGEVLEMELEALLSAQFPLDLIEPVAKGEFGGDVLQRVVNAGGQICGSILWESKRTKNWVDGWLPKLRGDQRAANAEIAVLMSQTLPKQVETFDLIDGVYITHPRSAIPIATMLRQSLIELAASRMSQEGQATKMELVYQYLTGPQFKHRVEAIVEKFSDMQEDLNREKKAMTRIWAKRESQIQGVLEATVGMYGDLQGIAGRAMQEIDGLDLELIEHDSEDAEGDA